MSENNQYSGLAGKIPSNRDQENPKSEILSSKQNGKQGIPETVKVSQEMDRRKEGEMRNEKREIRSQKEGILEEKSGKSKIQKMKDSGFLSNKFVRLGIFLIAGVGILFVILAIMTLLGLDMAVMKITMEGYVYDEVNEVFVEGATVFIDDEKNAVTNESGFYSISDLNTGKVSVTVSAENYQPITKEVDVSRSFMNYTTRADFIISSSGKGIVTGKLIADKTTYNFFDDKFLVNGTEYRISRDGTFELTELPEGEVSIGFISSSYKDFTRTVNIDTEAVDLGSIELEPAGDVVGELISYIREDIVLDTQILVNNVVEEQIEKSENGSFVVKDLEVDKEYDFRFIAEGYNTKDYTIKILQGENRIPNFKLVEEGRTIFLSQEGDNDSLQIYISDYDGSNTERLTNIEDLNPAYQYLDREESRVYLASQYEGLDGVFRDDLYLPYSVNVETKEMSRIINDTTDLGILFPNFVAQELVNITTDTSDYDKEVQILETMNIDGSDRKEIKRIGTGAFANIKLSDNGEFVYVKQVAEDKSTVGLFRIDLETNEEVKVEASDVFLFDVSGDGTRAVFSAKNERTGFSDLYLYDFSKNERRTLKENFSGRQYHFLNGTNDELMYISSNSGKDDIFTLSILDNKESRVTTLKAGEEIFSIYEGDEYVFYYTKKGLYVIDLGKPNSYKRVVGH